MYASQWIVWSVIPFAEPVEAQRDS